MDDHNLLIRIIRLLFRFLTVGVDDNADAEIVIHTFANEQFVLQSEREYHMIMIIILYSGINGQPAHPSNSTHLLGNGNNSHQQYFK